MKKRLIAAVLVILAAGLVGSAIGFGTDIPLRATSPYYRTALRIEREYPNVDVWKIEQDERTGYLRIELAIEGEAPGISTYVGEQLAGLINEDTRYVLSFVILYFPEGQESDGETANYWLVGVWTATVFSIENGDYVWSLQFPFNLGYKVPLKDNLIDRHAPWLGR